MVTIKHMYQDVEYKEVTKYSVKYLEVFVLKDLYRRMYEWLVENGYATRSDADFPEKYYLDRGGAAGKEVWFRWRTKKNPLPGKQQFWRFDINVDCHVLGLKDVELVVQNKKFKANKGEVEVVVAANLIMDASGDWSKNTLLKPFRSLYFKRALAKKKDMLEKELYKDAFDFRDIITDYFKLKSYIPTKIAGLEFAPRRTME